MPTVFVRAASLIYYTFYHDIYSIYTRTLYTNANAFNCKLISISILIFWQFAFNWFWFTLFTLAHIKLTAAIITRFIADFKCASSGIYKCFYIHSKTKKKKTINYVILELQSIRLIDLPRRRWTKNLCKPQKYNQINCKRIGRPISCG